MFAIIALTLASPSTAAPPPAPPACISPLPADRLAGRWIGPFAQSDWTFELIREGTSWAGRYFSTKSQTWHSLQEVTVTGGCVSFSLTSQPKLTFVLTLAADSNTLAGDIDIAGRAVMPFAAKRVS